MTLEEFQDYMRRLALKWVAECADNEGFWGQGYVGKYYSGKVDGYGDLSIFVKRGDLETFDRVRSFLDVVLNDDEHGWPNEEYERGYKEAAANALSIIENGVRKLTDTS